ncbi:MAG: polysaccharide deacetylase family protein [Anaerovoracaceae bacterium]
MRTKSTKKRRKKKVYKGVGRFVFFCVLIVAIIVGGFVTFKYLTRDNYDSERSFEKYSKSYFKDVKASNKVGEPVESFEYGQPASVGVIYPKVGKKEIDSEIKDYIETQKSDFLGEYSGEDKDKKFAMVTGYQSYESEKNTSGVALITVIKKENDRGKFEIVSEETKTFNFNTKNGSAVYPVIAFEAGYKENIEKLLKESLEDEYGKKLKSNYKDFISSDSKATESFVITDDGVNFYFNAGTVLDKEEGVITVKASNKDLKGILRDKINPRNIDPNKPMVAITFDDGPKAGTSDQILDAMEKYDSVATYFELGSNVANVNGASEILKRKEKLGCELASHSWDHPNLFTLSDAKVKEQNDKTDEAFKKAVGHAPTLYRPPYGNGNEKTTKIFNKSGILWSVDTLDWKSRNKDAIMNVIKSQKTLDGRVLLLHSIHQPSADAVDLLLPWLKEKGYQTVTVSELLIYKYKQDPTVPKFYGYNYFYGTEDEE